MKYTFPVIALAATVLATPIPEAAAAADPPSAKILQVSHGGSGCPQSADIDVNFSDTSILPIYFGKDFIASIGNGASPEQSRKNCQIALEIQYPKGWQYTIIKAEYQGWARLDPSVKARINSNYYFAGEVAQVSSPIFIDGPYDGKWKKTDTVGFNWSPCGGSAILNINADVALQQRSQAVSGIIAQTKESVRLGQNIWLSWRQC